MVASSGRRMMLRFAAVFAVAATVAWTCLETILDWSWPWGLAYMVLNFGGTVLSWIPQWLHWIRYPWIAFPPSAAEWAWVLAVKFAGSFVQGLAYALLWSVGRRTWTVSRLRAIAYPIAIALISYASFVAGANRFDDTHCGIGFDSDCVMGAIEGMTWAAVAFGIAVPTVALVESLIRKQSRSESSL